MTHCKILCYGAASSVGRPKSCRNGIDSRLVPIDPTLGVTRLLLQTMDSMFVAAQLKRSVLTPGRARGPFGGLHEASNTPN